MFCIMFQHYISFVYSMCVVYDNLKLCHVQIDASYTTIQNFIANTVHSYHLKWSNASQIFVITTCFNLRLLNNEN